MDDTKTILGWHFLPNDRLTANGENIKVFPGQTLILDERDNDLELCSWGYHASERAIDALRYAPGSIVCRVELSGKIIRGDDKMCATVRKCLWMADVTRIIQEFAIWCAEQAITTIRQRRIEVDPRSINAIEVARMWLNGSATKEDVDAAARAADAADTADAAAYAEIDAQNDKLTEMFLALENSEYAIREI